MSDRNATAPRAEGGLAAPLLVTAPEAARILAIGRTTLYQVGRDGDLTPIRTGRSVRFPIEQLRDFVDRRISTESGRS